MPLHERWLQTAATLCAAPITAVSSAGADLIGRYAEPHRHYHTARHLREVLDAIADLDLAGQSDQDAPLAVLAAFFHDAIYLPGAPDNEARSAQLAVDTLRALDADPEAIDIVAEIVLATDPKAPRPDRPAALALMLDADLWILAAPTDRFDAYCAGVRREYVAVPDQLYAAARSEVLGQLRDRSELYLTPQAKAAWTGRARANLDRELARLKP